MSSQLPQYGGVAHVTTSVAGLRHLPKVGPLVDAFLAMSCHLVDRQRQVVPSPHEVVTVTVNNTGIAEHLGGAGIITSER